MRALYILAHYPQNSESYVEAEMEYMIGRGVEIEVWSPSAGYGDMPKVQVHRKALADAIASFRPDVFHIHHMTTASYNLGRLPKNKSTTIRAHSFDWNDDLARRTVASPVVRKVFGFPHLARRVPGIEPLPVAYNSNRYFPTFKKANTVVRVSAGLPTKRLEDFIQVGNRLASHAEFTLAMNMVLGKEAAVVGSMTALNQSLGGHVKILTNLSKDAVAKLVQESAVYLSTTDERSHPFGMPISIAEAMATGSYVVARAADGACSYLGESGIVYKSVDEAVDLIRAWISSPAQEREADSRAAIRVAQRFRDDVVLPRLYEEWGGICLDNF